MVDEAIDALTEAVAALADANRKEQAYIGAMEKAGPMIARTIQLFFDAGMSERERDDAVAEAITRSGLAPDDPVRGMAELALREISWDRQADRAQYN